MRKHTPDMIGVIAYARRALVIRIRSLFVRESLIASIWVGMLALGAGHAAAQTAPKPTVEHAWARATVAMVKTGAAYFTITGHGAPDKLVSASTPVAEKAELHETIHDGNVMKMRPMDGLAVPATGAVVLDPGGYHLMLVGLKQPLVAGQHFPLSLTFQNSGAMGVDVVVEAAGAARPMAMDHAMPGMMPVAKP